MFNLDNSNWQKAGAIRVSRKKSKSKKTSPKKRSSRRPSKKQLEALSRGRAIRAKNIKKRRSGKKIQRGGGKEAEERAAVCAAELREMTSLLVAKDKLSEELEAQLADEETRVNAVEEEWDELIGKVAARRRGRVGRADFGRFRQTEAASGGKWTRQYGLTPALVASTLAAMSPEARDTAMTRLVDLGWIAGVPMIPPGSLVNKDAHDALSKPEEIMTHNLLRPLTPEEWENEQLRIKQWKKRNLLQ